MAVAIIDHSISIVLGVVTLLVGFRVIGPKVGTNPRYDVLHVRWLKHLKWLGPLMILFAATQIMLKVVGGMHEREPRRTADQLLGEAVKHLQNKRFDKAATLLERLAAQGDRVAQFALADELYQGTIRSSEADRPLLLLTSSAKKKYMPAQFALCLHHKDPIQAYAWCEVVASGNHGYSGQAKLRGAETLNNLVAPAGAPSVEAAKSMASSYVRDFYADERW
jgi:hypothetical protein